MLFFVDDFNETPAGAVPRVATSLCLRDHLGTIGARTGYQRNNYKVTPGLYCAGKAGKNSPVLVTANYKLSFDALRKELKNLDCWILVVDTRGINVWCAGGKGTFSAEEIAYQVQKAELGKIVSHRQLILPQLSANGVALHKLKHLCGFRGQFGPIRAADLPEYLRTGTASDTLRSVSFSLRERAALIPLEVCLQIKPLLFFILFSLFLSGISTEVYSLHQALQRTTTATMSTLMAIFTGAIVTPLFLPWIPPRQFWVKGLMTGAAGAALWSTLVPSPPVDTAALALWSMGCSSYLAMNFTGSTVFTSLSGVEKEMRKGLIFQVGAATLAMVLWLASPFV
ncbi:hypothetical protein FCL48_17195 [Desulforhopalus sp. IMCC35007]|nr:hypothetical protein FCL48_17195 [Desulforhopalus sp. IMCC35007]